ncbi:MAG: LAGLIDADG family homing endonuclease [Nitrososphaerota archaeon]
MNIVSRSISKEVERRRCLPLEIRLQMYDDVIELRKQELTQKEIQRKIYEKYGMRLPQPTICCWLRKKHYPLGRINKFDEKPSPELNYAVGTIIGDGYKRFDSRNYRFRLVVKDYEFAEEFGKCLAKVLKRREPYKPFWNEKEKKWIVEGCSIRLYKFLDKPLEELKPYIEYSKDCVSAFLRALFDGEGSIHGRILELHNTNIELLNYAKYLLKKYFDIDATGPYLVRKSGKIIYFPNGRIAKTTKDLYRIYIRTQSLLNFYKYIGFTIKRKRERLIKAIQ